MDENHSDAKEILRKRILEEKRNSGETKEPELNEKESSSVFQSFASNSMKESTSLFHSDHSEDNLPSADDTDAPEKISLFQSEAVSQQPDRLFSSYRNEQENVPVLPQNEVKQTEDKADDAFPLFIAFKANDSMQTVSEGVREKYSPLFGSEEEPSKESPVELKPSMSQENADRDIPPSIIRPIKAGNSSNAANVYYSDIGIPIFKPYSIPSKEYEELSYDIPDVFSDRDEVITPDQTEAAAAPDSLVPPPAGHTASGTPTARPGTRYSPAQQMGSTTSSVQREARISKAKKAKEAKKTKAKVQGHKPLLIFLLILAVIVGFFSLWSSIGNDGRLSFLGTKDSSSAVTKATSAAVTKVTSKETSKETVKETSKETTIAATSPTTPALTPTAAPVQETTTAATAATPVPAAVSAKIPSGFFTSISGGKSDGDTASFTILFKNQGGNDVSLLDGVEYITITYSTNSVKIAEVTSSEFTFTADPKKSNTFIGIPTDTEVIPNTHSKTVVISAKSTGAPIGNFTIKYYVKCYS